MNVMLHQKMNEAWDSIWEGLYCDQTCLFYDYRTSLDAAHRFDHLPMPDEIARQFPNPAGWGTGMEDSMLNSGSVMDVLRLRRELTGDTNAASRAAQLLTGMVCCARVHGMDGFVARSVSPRDGRSCYVNSSRDQFTLCVYGAWRFWHCFTDADKSLRALAKELLLDVAQYCRRVITDTHDNLLRLDGKPALVSTMVRVQAHEVLRLPMIYAAAWDVSHDMQWHDLYHHYALAGIARNLEIPHLNWCWNDWELAQMQISLELLRAVEPESELKQQYGRAMLYTAQLAQKLLSAGIKRAADFSGDWSVPNQIWRTAPMTVREETLPSPAQSMLFGGYPYMMPHFPEAYLQPYSILRSLGNLMCAALLSRDHQLPSEMLATLAQILTKPDYRTHCSDGPINALHGYWIGRDRDIW